MLAIIVMIHPPLSVCLSSFLPRHAYSSYLVRGHCNVARLEVLREAVADEHTTDINEMPQLQIRRLQRHEVVP